MTTASPGPGMKAWAPAQLFALALLCAGVGLADAGDASANSSGSLRAKYGALQHQLGHNQFQRPLYLDSSKTPGGVAGDIYALINYPFATVSAALISGGNWCDILILHLNTKYCRASTAGQENVLDVRIGRKHDQPLDEAHRAAFAYHVAAQTPDYLQIRLDADQGPLSTREYRIVLEAVPLENGQTFIHLSYSYAYGPVARLAMQAYLGRPGETR